MQEKKKKIYEFWPVTHSLTSLISYLCNALSITKLIVCKRNNYTRNNKIKFQFDFFSFVSFGIGLFRMVQKFFTRKISWRQFFFSSLLLRTIHYTFPNALNDWLFDCYWNTCVLLSFVCVRYAYYMAVYICIVYVLRCWIFATHAELTVVNVTAVNARHVSF